MNIFKAFGIQKAFDEFDISVPSTEESQTTRQAQQAQGYYQRDANGLMNFPPIEESYGDVQDWFENKDVARGLTPHQAIDYAHKQLSSADKLPLNKQKPLVYTTDDGQRVLLNMEEDGKLRVTHRQDGARANQVFDHPDVKQEQDAHGGLMKWMQHPVSRKTVKRRADITNQLFTHMAEHPHVGRTSTREDLNQNLSEHLSLDEYPDDTNRFHNIGKMDKMLWKMFGIRKDAPAAPLGDAFPQHEMTMGECETGQCLRNAHTTAKRNRDWNAHIIHGSHFALEGPHAWVEFDHPRHGKMVFDPTSKLAGSPKDMYEDKGNDANQPFSPMMWRMNWPMLIPEYKYPLKDYTRLFRASGEDKGFIDHPDYKIPNEEKAFPHPGGEEDKWAMVRQYGQGVQSSEDHPGYAPKEGYTA